MRIKREVLYDETNWILEKKMSFTDKGYEIVRNAITKELSDFCYQYLRTKRKIAQHFFKTNFIPLDSRMWGEWKDTQVLGTYSYYADTAMETLLEMIKPKMMEVTKLNLVPTYSYLRIYKTGDILERHRDRPSCEFSCTLNLGGDEWPIFLDPTGQEGNKGIKVILKPGDLLVYKGCDLEHWRDRLEGEECCQVFLHYNDKNGELGTSNIYDKRPFLGLPAQFSSTYKK